MTRTSEVIPTIPGKSINFNRNNSNHNKLSPALKMKISSLKSPGITEMKKVMSKTH